MHDNVGVGLHLDLNNINSVLEGNRIDHNGSDGIVIEISYKTTILNNTVTDNGWFDPRNRYGFLWNAGIGIHASPDVEVYGNTVSGNYAGVVAIEQNRQRDPASYGPHIVQNLNVHDNIITQTNLPRTATELSVAAGAATDIPGNSVLFVSHNNRFSSNTYYLGTKPPPLCLAIWYTERGRVEGLRPGCRRGVLPLEVSGPLANRDPCPGSRATPEDCGHTLLFPMESMRKSLLTVVALAVAVPLVLNCNDPLQPRTREQSQHERPSLAVGAAVGGSWAPPFNWPIITGHLGVLPDSRVISWMSGYVTGDLERHHVHVWNPTTGVFTELTDGTENIFCSGNAFFPDGRLLVPGGHISDSKGLKETYIFDWRSNTWTEVSTMRAGRWYPTTTALANGALTTVGGTEEDGLPNTYPELWNGSGWKVLRGARLNMLYFYPWMHPAPDGRVFNSGPDGVTRYLNPSGGGEWTLGPRTRGGYASMADRSCMLPARFSLWAEVTRRPILPRLSI